MFKMRKSCIWSEQALAARRIFTTPEVTAIQTEIEFKTSDYAANGEGYSTTSITFVKFACGFLLVYSFEHESWILQTIEIPSGGPQNPNRRRGRRRNGYERVIDELLTDWIGATAAVVYNITLRFCREIALFAADDHGLSARFATRAGVVAAVARYARARLADAYSQSCEDVVQLNRTWCSGTLRFVGPLWSLEALGPARLRDLWDPSWFGAPPEQVSG